MVLGALVPLGKNQLTEVIITNRRVEEASRSMLGRFALLSERLRICKYILHTNIAKNTPVVGAMEADNKGRCGERGKGCVPTISQ